MSENNNDFDRIKEDFYSDDFRQQLLENDEITSLEEGFMYGFEDGDYDDEIMN